MTQAYDRIIATITTASDAVSVAKAMYKNTEWREGTSGSWSTASCMLTASKVYQFRTPFSGMSAVAIAILPNIKASVVVEWDNTATAITTVGDYFMAYYAYNCTLLTSLGVPDTSGLTSAGTYFMAYYAYGCTALTSLNLPASTGWFATHNINWKVPAACLGALYGYTPDSTAQAAWQALTASGKTLYLNYIRAADHVLVSGGTTGNYTLTIDVGAGQTSTDYDGWDDLAAAIQDNAEDLVYCKIKQNGSPVLPTSLEALFAYCESLVTVVFDGLDTSSVQSMYGTFYGCDSLASLDLSGLDTSNVQDMSYMFSYCYTLTSLNLSSFDTSNVLDMNYMFDNCRALISLDLSNFDTSNVTSMSGMFTACLTLTSLNLSGLDTSNVLNMSYMCDSCSLLTTIYADSSWSVASVTDGEGMFNGCTSLVGAISYNPAKTDHTYANWTTGYFTYSGTPPAGIPLHFMHYQRLRGN